MGPAADSATFYVVNDDDSDQRLDNLLLRLCKGVPKSHVYRIIRGGEVRVNKGRVDVQYRIRSGDLIRIPPLRTAQPSAEFRSAPSNLVLPVVFEDEGLLVVNKPAGLAVHGGSGIGHGVVERLRASQARAEDFLELVHRLDRETSGILVLAKKRQYLVRLQEQIRQRAWKKYYQCLVMGRWPADLVAVDLPLLKTSRGENEKKVYVHPDGLAASTRFRVVQNYRHAALGDSTLLQAQILTGRTHQIRVHCAAKGHGILGDDKYGQFVINRLWLKTGLQRMFLHAVRLQILHPLSNETLRFEAELPSNLADVLKKLDAS